MTLYNRYGSNNLNYLWIMMILNFLVFLLTVFNSNLIYAFGISGATFVRQPWTILTSMFTHGSFWHILANMLTLYFFGSFIIRLVGEGRMLAIYMIGGLVGNLFFVAISYLGILGGSPFTVAVGASGAVFALGGALAILAPNEVITFPIPVPMPLWIAVIGSFFVLSLFPGIAWEAHLGGLIVGLLAGLLLKKQTPARLY